jgi:hypothetical protein
MDLARPHIEIDVVVRDNARVALRDTSHLERGGRDGSVDRGPRDGRHPDLTARPGTGNERTGPGDTVRSSEL